MVQRRLPLLLLPLIALAHGGVAAAQELESGVDIGQPVATPAPEPLPHDRAGETRMLRRINALRAQVGHGALERHDGLDAAAAAHSQDMARFSELVHVSARTGTPSDRISQASVDAERIAQNVARQANTADALGALLESEGHRAQLLDAGFTHIGLAAVRGEDGVYVTQVMAVLRPPRTEELPPPAVAELSPPASAAIASSNAAVPPSDASSVNTAAPQPAGAAQAPAAAAQPGQPGTPIPSIRVPAGHRRVAGYWLFQYGRWWYFPVPRGTPPGTVVRPDTRYLGPPPGVQTPPQGAAPAARPRPAPRPEAWRSPRRGQVYWY